MDWISTRPVRIWPLSNISLIPGRVTVINRSFMMHDQTFESFGETFFNRSFNYSECLPVADRQGDILMGTEGGMLVFSPDSIVKQYLF